MHDYSQFTSAFTLITQCLIVPLYPCYVVVFCCYAPVYITLYTSCNNLQLATAILNAYRYNTNTRSNLLDHLNTTLQVN